MGMHFWTKQAKGWIGMAMGAWTGMALAAAPPVNEALLQSDFPVQAACVSAPQPKGNTAMKGLAIRVGPRSSMLFDTELMRMAAGWREGFITTHGVAFDGQHGGHPSIHGEQVFGTPALPGWLGRKTRWPIRGRSRSVRCRVVGRVGTGTMSMAKMWC